MYMFGDILQLMQPLKELEEKDENAKEKMMQNILHKEEKRELEQVSFSFQELVI